ncbi:MAG: hypothetical protein SGBAC_010542 [Bacillariaceae sp.]
MFALLYSILMFLLLLAKQPVMPVVMPALLIARFNETTMPPTVEFVGTAEEIGCDSPPSSPSSPSFPSFPSMESFSSMIQSLNYESIKALVEKFEFNLDFQPTVSLVTNGFDTIMASAGDFYFSHDFIGHFDYDFTYDFDLEFLKKSFQHVYENMLANFKPPVSLVADHFDTTMKAFSGDFSSQDIIGRFDYGFDFEFLKSFQHVFVKLRSGVRNCFFPPHPPPPPRNLFDIQAKDIEAFGRTLLLDIQQVYEKLQAVVRSFFFSPPPPPPPPPRSFLDIRAIAVKAFKNVSCFNAVLEYRIRDAVHKIHEAFESILGLPTTEIILETMKQPTTAWKLTVVLLFTAAAVILQLLVTRAKALVAPAAVHEEIKINEVGTLPAIAAKSSQVLARSDAIVADEEKNLDDKVDPMADLCSSFSKLSISGGGNVDNRRCTR